MAEGRASQDRARGKTIGRRGGNGYASDRLSAGNSIVPPVPDFAEQLQHDRAEGTISFAGRRMLLLHVEAFTALRHEMVLSLGIEAARGLITRMGYLAGSMDAALARATLGYGANQDSFMVGPQIFAFQGYGCIDTVALELDLETGHNYGEFFWRNSPEADAHIAAFGRGTSPACWMETGYASGYGSAFMGKRILVREVECRAMGHAHCRSIAKPVEKWADPERDLKYLIARGPERQQSGSRSSSPDRPGKTLNPLGDEGRKIASDDAPIGASNAYITTMHKIHRVAPTHATVLLLGESGVGKSILAREVHHSSRRADRPFVEVNCATIPEQLIEAELFGVERGAYTGATATRRGRFEVADGGTLFLDEIALLTPTAQGKLLRVLQTGEMEHLGSTQTQKVDVRVVAATNEDLNAAIRQGRFREDLFYRINVFPILVPPLRERLDDIPVLLEHCLKTFAARHNREVVGVTPFALQAICEYNWPGNIREFENVIERGLILADDGCPIDTPHLVGLGDISQPEPCGPFQSGRGDISSGQTELRHPADVEGWARAMLSNRITIDDVEDALIKVAVEQTNGNVAKAALLLGVPRGKLDYRLKKSGKPGSRR